MSRLIKAKSDVLQGLGMSLKEGAVLSEISKAKAKGEGPAGMAVRARSDPSSSTSTLTFIADVSYTHCIAPKLTVALCRVRGVPPCSQRSRL